MIKIYKITNNINGLSYIGQTKQSLKRRFNAHSKPSSYCVKLRRAIEKYGADNFSIEIIAECAPQYADIIEIFLIAKYDSISTGYNIRAGGSGYSPNRGKHSGLVVSSFKGKTHTSEAKAKMRQARLGKSPVNKGKKGMVSLEARLRMSEIKKQQWITGVAIGNTRKAV